MNPGFSHEELLEEQRTRVSNVEYPEGPKGPTELQKLLQAKPFTPKERSIILATCCGGATQAEADQLIAIAEARGLNPIAGECHFVKRRAFNESTNSYEERWAVQASIDAFRIKADETGLYDGQDEPEYIYSPAPEERLIMAKVRVWRKGWTRPSVGVARYDEYVQTKRDGSPTRFWRTMPHTMLAKCAEAQAFRRAFPSRFSGIYTADEMMQAENAPPAQVSAAPAPPGVFAPVAAPGADESGVSSAERVRTAQEIAGIRSTREPISPHDPETGELGVTSLEIHSEVLVHCETMLAWQSACDAIARDTALTPKEKKSLRDLAKSVAERIRQQPGGGR